MGSLPFSFHPLSSCYPTHPFHDRKSQAHARPHQEEAEQPPAHQLSKNSNAASPCSKTGVLEEYNVERVSDRNIVGGIFKGKRASNIEPGLKAMFVDIGYEKNAFLHFWDALPGLDETKHRAHRPRPDKDGQEIRSQEQGAEETHRQGYSRPSTRSAARCWCRSPRDPSAPRGRA